ncbi:MAG: hypothetical protein IAF02_23855 [Anaerolineae bacterium]|nr:hypothetical protein [Anaerolineae bacterium]
MNQTKVADLTIDEFRSLIQDVVTQTMSDLLRDPEHELELNPDIELRLRESLAEYKTESSLLDAQSVADKLDIAW